MALRTIDFSAGQITDGTAGGLIGDNVLAADGMIFTITAEGNWTAGFGKGRFNFAEDPSRGGSQFSIVLSQADGRTFNFKDILFSADLNPVLVGDWASNVNIGGLSVPDDDIHGTGSPWTYSYLFPNGPLPQAGQSLIITDVPAASATTPNPNPNPTTSLWFDNLVIDTRPGINSILRTGNAITSSDTVTFSVNFSDPVTGVDLTDFNLSTSGSATGSISDISGGGSTYTVSVTGVTGTGTLKLNINGTNTGIQDVGGSLLPFGFSGGEAYTIDNTPPAVPSSPNLDPGSDSNIITDNITKDRTPTLTGTGEVGATIRLYDTDGVTELGLAVADGSGQWSITSRDLADGQHILTVRAEDGAGNLSASSSSVHITVDSSAPVVSSIDRVTGELTNAQTLAYAVVFNESVTGLDASDFTLSGNGAAGTIVSFSGSGSSYVVAIEYVVGEGTLRLDLNSSNTGIIDTAGNAIAGGFSAGQTYTVDHTKPEATVLLADTALIAGETSTVTISFSEAVTGLTADDLTVSGGMLSEPSSSDGGVTWTSVFTPNASFTSATNIISIAQGAVTDLAGNSNDAASSENYTVDTAPPSGSAPDLDAGSDTGPSSTDNITRSSSLTLTGSGETGTQVTIFDDRNGNGFHDQSEAILGTTTVVDGGWAIISDDHASDASLTLRAAYQDSAGNTSVSGPLLVTIDVTAPVANVDVGTFSLVTSSALIGNVFINDVGATAVSSVGGAPNKVGSAVSASDGGTITINADGSASFAPDSTFDGLRPGATRPTSVSFEVTDAAGNTGSSALTVLVTGKNDAPELLSNTGLTVTAGKSAVVSGSALRSADVDDSALDLTYTLLTLPNEGLLSLSGSALAVGSTFTQADIDAGRISFAAGNTAGPRSFDFSLADGGEDGVTPILGTFGLTVSAPPTIPTIPSSPGELIDGVRVVTGTVRNPDGTTSQVVDIPVVSSDRIDQSGGSNVADIPLVTDASGNSLLGVQMPAGFGLTVTGSMAPQPAANALADLIRQISSVTSSGSDTQSEMTTGGSGFLSALPTGRPVIVETFKLVVPANNPPGEPLIINGSGATGAPASALIIDASGVPAGTEIVLNNVGFAAVIGQASVTLGQGSQVVFGDSSAQTFQLGDGGDIVFGGGGLDTAVYDVGYQDVRAYMNANGELVIESGNGLDRLDGVERIELSDREIAFQPVDAEGVEGQAFRLYQAAFDRFADISGLDFWTDMLERGNGDMTWLAGQFLSSSEFAESFGSPNGLSNNDFITLLYSNVLHRAGDTEGFAYWQDRLEQGMTREHVLASFAESDENIGSLGIDGSYPVWN